MKIKVKCKIVRKFNPCSSKTIHGDTYYSGCYFSNRGPEEDRYRLKLDKSKVREIIIKEITKN